MKPVLFASPETGREIGAASAALILIGGYDGSGNYGDIALLEAALRLAEHLGPDLLLLPLLERGLGAGDREPGEPELGAARAIYFDPEGSSEDDLLPVAAPAGLAFGACYLYGGGYLNRSWGQRKLAMLTAAAALLEAGGVDRVHRFSSGLQVNPDWVAELPAEDQAALSSFDSLGVRDRASATGLEALGPDLTVSHTGDDAIGLLAPTAPAAAAEPPGDGPLRVNVHLGEHAWVSEQPEALLDFLLELLEELGRLTGKSLLVQPLLAYLDPRTDERPAGERLASAGAVRGIEVAEPLLLRPAQLDAAAERLDAASLTLCCSFHVALTSLLRGLPTVLLADNPYYAQKAAGLAEDFGLPTAFTPAAGSDPGATAAAVAAVLGDPEAAAALRLQLASAADRLRRGRGATETELLGRLAAALTSDLLRQFGEQTERLRERSAEPAELRAELAATEAEQERLRHLVAVESPLEAELRAREAEARADEARAVGAEALLESVLGSRSWRAAEPLRRIGALARRRA